MLSKYRVEWRGKKIGLEYFIIRQRFSIQPRRCLVSCSRLIPCSVLAAESPRRRGLLSTLTRLDFNPRLAERAEA